MNESLQRLRCRRHVVVVRPCAKYLDGPKKIVRLEACGERPSISFSDIESCLSVLLRRTVALCNPNESLAGLYPGHALVLGR